MIADLATGPETGSSAGWSPMHSVVEGGVAYLALDDGIHGMELFRSDGTAAGTRLVADICPGIRESGPQDLAVHDGIVYFSADDCVHGRELWRSDGTAAGTWMVADISPGPSSSNPAELEALPGGVVFLAADPAHGSELWRSDGTGPGTVLVLDILPGAGSSAYGYTSDVVRLGDRVVFDAGSGGADEVWASDGTAAGTERLSTVGGSMRNPRSLFAPGWAIRAGLLYYVGDDGQLWATDGTPAGTHAITTGLSANQTTMAANSSLVFFRADDGIHGYELWTSDGTTAGTHLAVDLAEPETNYGSSPAYFVRAGERIVFRAVTAAEGMSLWATDGTPAGTQFLLSATSNSWFGFLLARRSFGNLAFLELDDGVHGFEPWITDGTPAGTAMLADLIPGAGSSFVLVNGLSPLETYADVLPELGGALLFRAMAPQVGLELFSTHGAPGDLALLADVDAQSSAFLRDDGFLRRRPERDVASDGARVLARAAGSGDTADFWWLDGPGAAPRSLGDFSDAIFEPQLGQSADLLVYGARGWFSTWDPTHGNRLWSTDGSASGTALVDDEGAPRPDLGPRRAPGGAVERRLGALPGLRR